MTTSPGARVVRPSAHAATEPLLAFAPAAALIGATGTIVGLGHDGLALTLGLAGGAFLWASGVLPFGSAAHAGGGLPAYLERRYGSPVVGYMATAVLAIALLFLLAAEVTAVTSSFIALTPYLPIGIYAPVVVLLIAASLATLWLSSSQRLPGISALAIGLGLIALLLALAALSGPDGAGVLVSTPTLGEIGTLERSLLEKRLADPALFKPFASPFLRMDLANTLSVVVCLSLGAAVLAAARAGSGTTHGSTPPRHARTLVLTTLALVLIPALAAAARRTLLATFDTGLKIGSLPAWLTSLQTSGAAVVCNAPPEAGPAAILKACGKGVGTEGLMRWQDVSFGPDSILAAALSSLPETPLSNGALAALMLASVIAAIATAYGAAVILHDALLRPADESPPDTWSRVTIIVLLWLFAALFAFTKPASSATLLVWAASIAAAGLGPVLIACALPRPSKIAALIAMLLGTALVLALTLSSRYDALDALAVSTAYEPMAPPALRKMTSLFTALGLAADAPAKAALMNQIDALARDNVSWIGLKPVAAGAWALLASALVMALDQAMASGIRRVKKRESSEAL